MISDDLPDFILFTSVDFQSMFMKYSEFEYRASFFKVQSLKMFHCWAYNFLVTTYLLPLSETNWQVSYSWNLDVLHSGNHKVKLHSIYSIDPTTVTSSVVGFLAGFENASLKTPD